jgi:outer membrane protein OmpA-like peptidoglycan-associated protein
MRIEAWRFLSAVIALCILLGGCSWLPKVSFKPKQHNDMVASADSAAPLRSADGAPLLDSAGRAVGTGYGDCVNLGYSIVNGEVSGECAGVAAASGNAPAPQKEKDYQVEEIPVGQPAAAAPPVAVPPAPPPSTGAVTTPVPAAPSATVREVEPQIPGQRAAGAVGTQQAPPMQKITLQSDLLFPFGKAEVKNAPGGGKKKLEDLAAQILSYDPSTIHGIDIVGHADRLGKAAANQRLSERRAGAVKGYLVQRGVDGSLIKTAGKGSTQPVVQCAGKKKTKKLVACLQPNRRVDVNIHGQKKT